MFKIGEFSRLGQVSTRMLRHYDKLGLLTPSHTDKWTSYRYYTIDQLSRLHRIIALKEMGLALEQIAQLLDGGDELPPERLRGMLMIRRAELERELQEGQARLMQVEARLSAIEQQAQPLTYEVVVKEVAPLVVASVSAVVPTVYEMGYYCDQLYQQLYASLHRQGIVPSRPELTLYHLEEYSETDLDVEIAVPVDPAYLSRHPSDDDVTFRELPGSPQSASLIYEGPLSEMLPAVLSLLNWVGSNRHVAAGPLTEIHLSDLARDPDVEDLTPVTELQIPIRPIAHA